jgi:hypothetical protein
MAAISYAPPLQALFHTAALSAADWAVLTAFGAVLLVAEELRKWAIRRRSVRRPRDVRPSAGGNADGPGV